MSLLNKNSFAPLLIGAVLFGAVVAPGCSSDDQVTPTGGAGATAHAGSGSGGKTSTAGSAGKAADNAGDTGSGNTGNTGNEGGASGAGNDNNNTPEGGAAGAAPTVDCDQSFDNSTLTAITDNGGKLPDLP